MARRITDEQIITINELYLELGVKKRVAEIMGISPASVTRYLIPNYKSTKEQVAPPPFDESKIKSIDEIYHGGTTFEEFARGCQLSEEEWAELRELQEEIMI